VTLFETKNHIVVSVPSGMGKSRISSVFLAMWLMRRTNIKVNGANPKVHMVYSHQGILEAEQNFIEAIKVAFSIVVDTKLVEALPDSINVS
jgi:hypothetical protein